MSLQKSLNDEALNYFPLLKEYISKAESIDANQMYCNAIKRILNAKTPVSKMSDAELNFFECDALTHFKGRGWIVITPDKYKKIGCHLYELQDESYIHVYQNIRCKTMKSLISSYESSL